MSAKHGANDSAAWTRELGVVLLDGVEDADFFRIKTPQTAGVPEFALHKVSDFAVHMCGGVPDTQLKTADDKTL